MKKSSIALMVMLGVCAAFADMGDERQSRTYQAAMADYSAGRLDAAIGGFEKAVEANGNNASARFQLACLLQDYRKDWLGAMCSYREYLRLEGSSDKAPLAKERLAQCERELAGELAKKYSLAPQSADSSDGGERGKTSSESEKKAADALRQLEEARKRVATLERENARLRRQLRAIGEDASDEAGPRGSVASENDLLNGDDDESAGPRSIAPAARAVGEVLEGSPRKINQEAADAIVDDGRTGPAGRKDASAYEPDDPSTGLRQGLADAKKLVEEDESGPELLQGEDHSRPAVRGKLSDFAARGGDGQKEERIERPATYVVQDGDSLYKIARRFYGKESAWKKIRDANKATISTDGRVRKGQTIVLP